MQHFIISIKLLSCSIYNAVKYSQQHLNIQVTTSSNETGLRVAISDLGVGIPHELQEQILQPFFPG